MAKSQPKMNESARPNGVADTRERQFATEFPGPVLVAGRVLRRVKATGNKGGRDWERRTFTIQAETGLTAEVVDFSGALSPEVGQYVVIPVKPPVNGLFPLAGGGGVEF